MEADLIIEITRKCNMTCAHCLRGEAEKVDIDLKYIDTLLDQISYVRSITFTGGEPSLNVSAITYFREQAQLRNIPINSFFIYTNGAEITEEFVIECLRFFVLSEEKDLCGVQVSNDYYHTDSADQNVELLSGLKFFSNKYKKPAYQENLINEGRAKDLCITSRDLVPGVIETKEQLTEMIYLNCYGKIINGCDWSYDNQKHHVLCDVTELTSFYTKLKEE